jgi:oligopeptide/dipeptide ABC transporter ATP-binding protein
MTEPHNRLLTVKNLRTHFRTDDGLVRAVDDVSFHIDRGETFALVGESGCGKSVTSFSILKLLPYPPAMHPAGNITLDGRTLMDIQPKGKRFVDAGLDEQTMRSVRGRQVSMIFQEPMSSLNPVFTCGSQIVEAIHLHRRLSRTDAKNLAVELLGKVGIADPARRFNAYPHQLSGGMRQRVMVAMALSCNPQLLIADEPTTALDVTIQAQILDLLNDLQTRETLSILLITHDLAVVAENAHRVAVMYASKIVETADVNRLFEAPRHPYTLGLFRSIPRLGEMKDRLATIPGSVPNPVNFPTGCKFHPRCERTRKLAAQAGGDQTVGLNTAVESTRVLKRCATCEPPLKTIAPSHCCACWEAEGYPQDS